MGRRERLGAVLEEHKADVFLAANGPTVTWATGYVPEESVVRSPFEAGALALVETYGLPTLIVSELEQDAARASGLEVLTYPFSFSPDNSATAVADAVVKAVRGRAVATEAWALPAVVAGRIDVKDVSSSIAKAQAAKDPDELARIRAAIRLCDIGQAAAREASTAGVSELDVWAAVRAAVERAAGCTVEMRCDLLSGPRTTLVGGSPTSRVIAASDTVLFDLFLRHEGYWGDSASTFSIGAPSAAVVDRHARVRAALERGLAVMGPGRDVRDVERAIRKELTYPHLSGHGLGTSLHEEPRVAGFGHTALEENMVITIEPGIYDDEPGVRLEQVVLITRDGCEQLSKHDLSLMAR